MPDNPGDMATSEVVQIARCPVHGLHGERDDCFVCGGPVERVAMVPLGDVDRGHHWLWVNAWNAVCPCGATKRWWQVWR